MPTSAIGLVVFLALITPGLAFTAIRETRLPPAKKSPFRESASVAVASFACWIVALATYGAVRAAGWAQVPDPQRLLIEHHRPSYVRHHYTSIGGWAFAILTVALAVAAVAGRFWPQPKGVVRPVSSWWECFHADPLLKAGLAYAQVELTDGTLIEGWVKSADSSIDEGQDRDLVLGGPLLLRRRGANEAELSHHRAIVNASQIRYILVTYRQLPAQAAEALPDTVPAGVS